MMHTVFTAKPLENLHKDGITEPTCEKKEKHTLLEYSGEARMDSHHLLTVEKLSWPLIHLSASQIYTKASIFFRYCEIDPESKTSLFKPCNYQNSSWK